MFVICSPNARGPERPAAAWGLPVDCKEVRVLEERGAGTECGNYQSWSSVAPDGKNHVLAKKAPCRNHRDVQDTCPATVRVEVFCTPASVTNHLLDVMG